VTKVTVKKREKFLSSLADGQSVTSAAKEIGLTRQTMYRTRAADAKFAALWDEAIEAGTDTLEDEAVKRAKSSSDVLLIFLLKSRRPEKYREHAQLDITSDGRPLLEPLLAALEKVYGK
jgi:hypothetical protein